MTAALADPLAALHETQLKIVLRSVRSDDCDTALEATYAHLGSLHAFDLWPLPTVREGVGRIVRTLLAECTRSAIARVRAELLALETDEARFASAERVYASVEMFGHAAGAVEAAHGARRELLRRLRGGWCPRSLLQTVDGLLDDAPSADVAKELRSVRRVVAAVEPDLYLSPGAIERAWRHHLERRRVLKTAEHVGVLLRAATWLDDEGLCSQARALERRRGTLVALSTRPPRAPPPSLPDAGPAAAADVAGGAEGRLRQEVVRSELGDEEAAAAGRVRCWFDAQSDAAAARWAATARSLFPPRRGPTQQCSSAGGVPFPAHFMTRLSARLRARTDRQRKAWIRSAGFVPLCDSRCPHCGAAGSIRVHDDARATCGSCEASLGNLVRLDDRRAVVLGRDASYESQSVRSAVQHVLWGEAALEPPPATDEYARAAGVLRTLLLGVDARMVATWSRLLCGLSEATAGEAGEGDEEGVGSGASMVWGGIEARPLGASVHAVSTALHVAAACARGCTSLDAFVPEPPAAADAAVVRQIRRWRRPLYLGGADYVDQWTRQPRAADDGAISPGGGARGRTGASALAPGGGARGRTGASALAAARRSLVRFLSRLESAVDEAPGAEVAEAWLRAVAYALVTSAPAAAVAYAHAPYACIVAPTISQAMCRAKAWRDRAEFLRGATTVRCAACDHAFDGWASYAAHATVCSEQTGYHPPAHPTAFAWTRLFGDAAHPLVSVKAWTDAAAQGRVPHVDSGTLAACHRAWASYGAFGESVRIHLAAADDASTPPTPDRALLELLELERLGADGVRMRLLCAANGAEEPPAKRAKRANGDPPDVTLSISPGAPGVPRFR